MKVKITINSEDRIIMIPMNYDNENDTLEINKIEVEPLPEKDEDVSDDIVFNIARFVLSALKGNNS